MIHRSRLFHPMLRGPAMAFAALAAATGGASAQTGSTAVTMYGIADVGIMSTSRGSGAPAVTQVMSGVNSTSRWGIRGSEDLGGGMKAMFNFEAQVNVDEGSGAATGGGLNFARRSFVGLEGAFGQVYLGRDYTPGYYVAIGNDTFRYGLWGSTITFSSGAGGLTTRASNAIFYRSPKLGGVEFRAMYGVGERDAAPARGGDIAGVGAYWSSGPVNLAAYYHDLKVVTAGSASTTSTRQYGIGGGWDLGGFRLNAGYGASDPAGASNTLSHAYAGGSVKAGKGELLAQVMLMRRELNRQRATTIAVGYMYPLSRRTNLYATFGRTGNNASGAFPLNNAANSLAAAAAGADPRAFGVGIRHAF